ncbi:MAG: pilus assembly protein PilP [Gammaproteobacteria bacterium]|nr:pilus assembly protein PilP [Gammaproteobacteria bacterium]
MRLLELIEDRLLRYSLKLKLMLCLAGLGLMILTAYLLLLRPLSIENSAIKQEIGLLQVKVGQAHAALMLRQENSPKVLQPLTTADSSGSFTQLIKVCATKNVELTALKRLPKQVVSISLQGSYATILACLEAPLHSMIIRSLVIERGERGSVTMQLHLQAFSAPVGWQLHKANFADYSIIVDPFYKSLVRVMKPKSLRDYQLKELQLVGIIAQGQILTAIIMDPYGQVYSIKPGMRIAKDQSRVEGIQADGVSLKRKDGRVECMELSKK